MTITKADMTERLIDEQGMHKREARVFVECFFEEIRVALEGYDNHPNGNLR